MKFKLMSLLFFAVLVVSCERKLRPPDMNGNGPAGLLGNWKFLSTGGTTVTSSEVDLFGVLIRTDGILNYTSSNPKGFYTITSTDFNGIGIGYDFAGSLTIKSFENGVLQNEVITPFPASTIPPTNTNSTYKLIGTDSIYFQTQAPGVQLQGAGSAVSTPSGCKYKINGNQLTMFLKFSNTTTDNTGGITSINKQQGDVTVVLERQ